MNERLGIVRKCDMCAGRLAAGEAPACVGACPNGAIKITLVETAAVAAAAVLGAVGGTATLVPGAPPSAITEPTTTYRTTREVPADTRAADHHALSPAQGHLPLAFMLVLTQAAVGAMAWATAAGPAAHAVGAIAAAVGVAGLAVSVAHLGRPRHAWRAVIGLSHSWVSREIVAFGGFTAFALAATVAVALAPTTVGLLRAGAVVGGVGGVTCSAMIYAVCHRQWWRAARSLPLFFSTTGGAGMAVAVGVAAWTGASDLAWPALVVAAIVVAQIVADSLVARHRGLDTDLGRTAALLAGALRPRGRLRIALAAVGMAGLLLGAEMSPRSPVAGGIIATFGAVLLVAADIVERQMFFTAAAGPRMPGGFR